MDKTWISKPRASLEYLNGVEHFLDFAFAKSAEGDEILCPCVKCRNNYWLTRDVVHEHLICKGFNDKYNDWIFHGEGFLSSGESDGETDVHDNQNINDDVHGLLHDAFIDVMNRSSRAQGKGNRKGPDDNATKFFNLLKNAEEELYPGCQKFSVLSFVIRLYLIKCLNGWSIASFNSLLTTLLEAFPFAKIPESFNKVKSMVKDLGLDYQKIDACPNNCVLFRKQYKKEEVCPKCGVSRWNKNRNSTNVNNDGEESMPEGKKIPAKILRYFPLIPRLQRLFMSSRTASFMKWHDEERNKDRKLRHAADGQAWKDFDQLHPEFASNPRNVRLGLASDGFNPFRTMSISHSTWPVLLMAYNLPPWMFMKSEYIMLCLLIPGPRSPGNNIDVYLEPLIEDLKILWDSGVATYDASTNETFQMRAALLWTISDFPAYAMLSGWSTKGKLACPCCNYDTCSQYLRHSKKMCYMGHRRFLDASHKWRHDKSSFDGNIELRPPPQQLSGTRVLEHMCNLVNEKNQGREHTQKGPWKKKSIFFELPYWGQNSLRHNLDVMHIEKNICDNILGTLLDIPGKTKDHANARFDLKEMGIRKKLQPKESQDSRKTILPKACFSLTNEEKDVFCEVMKNVKLPDGCASNIARCVQVKERKILGYKSHDAHFIMHYLLKVAVRKTMPKCVGVALIRLSDFFKCLCSKVIEPKDLDHLQGEIVEILCQLEKIFPPSFFDIMVHLPIHLVNEAKLGGPVVYRWMYPIERFLCKLKSYRGNRSRPEGSIAEAYLAEECLNFCSRYLGKNVDTRFNRPSRNSEKVAINEENELLFQRMGRPIGSKKNGKGKIIELDENTLTQAHRYLLFNCDEIQEYISEHQNLISNRHKKRKWKREQTHSQNFALWFEHRVMDDESVSERIKELARGPNNIAQSFSGYLINGYRFHTRRRDSKRKTQNSGVTLSALTSSFASSKDKNPVISDVVYYGAVTEIIQFDYYGSFEVVLFKCDWFHAEQDDYGLTRVNFKKLIYIDDPFVMASQVHQVFYVQDPKEKDWHYVMQTVLRDLFDMKGESVTDEDGTFSSDLGEVGMEHAIALEDIEVNVLREDVEGTIIEQPMHMFEENLNLDENQDDDDEDDSDWVDSDGDSSMEEVEGLTIDKLLHIFGEDFNLEEDTDEENDFSTDNSTNDE